METSNQVIAIQGKQGHFAKFCKKKESKSPRRSAQVNQSGIKELLTRWTSRIIQLKKNDYMHLPSLMRNSQWV